jgi:acyl dehydratase
MSAPQAIATATVGTELPAVEFGPITRAKLALYAGASGDHNPVHIDLDFARKAGLNDVFAHGMLSFGVLSQVVTRWAGIGRLREFGARFVSITNVHDVVRCTGTVTERFEANGEQRLRIAVVATAQDGRQTLVGDAVIALD